jgi:predicted nuclease of predicted toxin-antitoxin system
VKFLLDANLSPALAQPLRQAGHQAIHVVDADLLTAADAMILRHAADQGYAVITADSDFPTMLALHNASAPSVIHLRHINELSWQEQARLLVSNLPTVLDDLANGAIVSLSPTRMAVRRLPIR